MKKDIPTGRRFAIIDRAFKYRLEKKAEQLGLTAVQLRVLGVLSRLEASGAEEIHQRDLEQAEQVTHPTMTEMIKRLEKKGFVVCSTSTADRRFKRIRCTESSRYLYEELEKEEEKIAEELCQGLSATDRDALLRITDRILENIGYPAGTRRK